MTSWPVPNGFHTGYADAVTGATPLAIIKEGIKNGEPLSGLMEKIPTMLNMFLGKMGGSMGEVAAVALLIGFVYMLYRKINHMAYPGFNIRKCGSVYNDSLVNKP